MTSSFHIAKLWGRGGWQSDVIVEVDKSGVISKVARGDGVTSAKSATRIDGWVIPGLVNAHSHAFQFAMAGVAEHLSGEALKDDFWSWREAMYGLALKVSPDALEVIAAMLYAEMLRAGYTHVAEFHYLHHDPNGEPYADLAEMSSRLIAAAEGVGIGLTILPTFYQRGGFSKEATPRQRRFLSATHDDFRKLHARIREVAKGKADVGAAVHSLRAVAPADAKAVLSDSSMGVRHIHVAEQLQEVDDCLAFHKKRPVEWLLDNVELGQNHALVHATHMTKSETKRLAASRAVVVLCPTTEGNLGDGLFDLGEFLRAGGSFAIGADSHVTVNALEELRWLDYGQRLRDKKRNVVCQKSGDDSGEILLEASERGGRAALGLNGNDAFSAGAMFDAIELDPSHPAIAGRQEARVVSGAVYAGDKALLKTVWRGGRKVISEGRHKDEARLRAEFARAVAGLL